MQSLVNLVSKELRWREYDWLNILLDFHRVKSVVTFIQLSSQIVNCIWTEREQENGGLDDGSTRDYENGEENDTDSGKNVDNGHDESPVRRYRGSRSSSKTIVSVQRTARVQKPSRNGTWGTFWNPHRWTFTRLSRDCALGSFSIAEINIP